ncbi:PP2C family protein-serine/threonine phosphatase [Streptomyces sp. NBC_01408]|uniref:PP2C family protein-serine/threonine phosphatase n=1 Tax=Streptomyces sp. NBC_01408 TaxID=2903855 RepID=UPI00224D3A2D|nr:PP2C family protein-serine/threonine phosphatase [Streptomyces sp. NBC_01408]MCX4694298.1 serine/threonine-protein phosphatase [Streptomyces sp. NBC_01408]
MIGEMPQVRRVCVAAWGGAAVSWELSTPGRLAPSLATCAAFLLLATGCALHIRHLLLAELRQSQEIAGAAQRALLRPLPGRIEGLTLAAAQLSASRGAAVGGDLYEAVPTGYGVRVVIGDVRGHGLPALGAATAVLGAFREAAYDEPSLGGVLVRMERALGRHVRGRARAEHPSACPAEPESPAAEEFVTVLLLQIAPDGTLLALNCGHPWPYLLHSRDSAPDPAPQTPAGLGSAELGSKVPSGGLDCRAAAISAPPAIEARGLGGGAPAAAPHGTGAPAGHPAAQAAQAGAGAEPRRSVRQGTDVQVLDGETMPPLGVVPVPADTQPHPVGELRPGETLFLHTDGAEDARDAAGRFFPLRRVLAEEAAVTPARLVAGVHAALLRHTGGRLADDVALLVLRDDRS